MKKNKRKAPKVELIKKLSILLKADLELLYNLAGDSIQSVPPDLSEYIENNPKTISLIRSLKNSNFSEDEIDMLIKKTEQSKTKALIVAAGLGSRLKDHTENLPKCMLDFWWENPFAAPNRILQGLRNRKYKYY